MDLLSSLHDEVQRVDEEARRLHTETTSMHEDIRHLEKSLVSKAKERSELLGEMGALQKRLDERYVELDGLRAEQSALEVSAQLEERSYDLAMEQLAAVGHAVSAETSAFIAGRKARVDCFQEAHTWSPIHPLYNQRKHQLLTKTTNLDRTKLAQRRQIEKEAELSIAAAIMHEQDRLAEIEACLEELELLIAAAEAKYHARVPELGNAPALSISPQNASSSASSSSRKRRRSPQASGGFQSALDFIAS